MQVIALLRGGTPTGENRIPKMAYLAKILKETPKRTCKRFVVSEFL